MFPLNLDRRKQCGFTLVELLITMVLFSVVMTSLVVGLNSGISSWKRVRDHQQTMAVTQHALDIISQDLRHMAKVSDEEPALVVTQSNSKGTSLHFSALVPHTYHFQARGAVWANVEYAVVDSEDGKNKKLQRTWTPYIADSTLQGSEEKLSIISDVESVQFRFLSQDGLQPDWNQDDTLPMGVMISIKTNKWRTIEQLVTVPLGIQP